jgi:hypothetical protein
MLKEEASDLDEVEDSVERKILVPPKVNLLPSKCVPGPRREVESVKGKQSSPFSVSLDDSLCSALYSSRDSKGCIATYKSITRVSHYFII